MARMGCRGSRRLSQLLFPNRQPATPPTPTPPPNPMLYRATNVAAAKALSAMQAAGLAGDAAAYKAAAAELEKNVVIVYAQASAAPSSHASKSLSTAVACVGSQVN